MKIERLGECAGIQKPPRWPWACGSVLAVSSRQRGGRPRSAQPRRSIQVKLLIPEVQAFDALVKKRSFRATRTSSALTRSDVLREIVLQAIAAEEIRIPMPEPATTAGTVARATRK
jgi:hypothetical protein